MRIGYIAPSLDDTTGWGRWCNDVLRNVRAQGVRPVIFAPAGTERFLPPDLADCPSHFVLPKLFDYAQSSNGIEGLAQLPNLWKVDVKPYGLDLVHSMDAWPWGIYGDWVARESGGVPHVMTTHGRYGYIAQHRWLDRTWYRRLLKRTRSMITVSEAVRRAVLVHFSDVMPPERFRVMYNPIDFRQLEVEGTLPPDVPTQGPLLLAVTRFSPVKDIETLARAHRLVRQEFPDVPLYVVGPGNHDGNAYFRMVRDIVANEGITGVHFVGRVPKPVLAAFYRRATMLVHAARTLPDDFEASGLILWEAGVFSLPCVVSDSGGISELVAHDGNGLLAKEHDPRALADAILTLLRDPERGRRLGAGNLARAQLPRWDKYIAEQLEVYREALASR
jgi:glycosyltransferase involved in cell wall biosynthesis